MRKIIIAIAVFTLISASSVIAAETSKEEKIGVGSGAIIGAIAGGPVGFIIGASIGAKIGDTMHQKNDAIETLSGSLAESRTDVRKLHSTLGTVSNELERVRCAARPDLISSVHYISDQITKYNQEFSMIYTNKSNSRSNTTANGGRHFFQPTSLYCRQIGRSPSPASSLRLCCSWCNEVFWIRT